jgi:hypothetical protein
MGSIETRPTDQLIKLAPGTTVRHANPDLADWIGEVCANTRGQFFTTRFDPQGEARVKWIAGTDADGRSITRSIGWVAVSAIQVAKQS